MVAGAPVSWCALTVNRHPRGVGMDLLDAYRRSLAEFTDRARQVRPDQWRGPTPCLDWDVRTLINHIVNEDRWTVPVMAGATIADVGDRFDGDRPGHDPAGNTADPAHGAGAASR